MLILLLSSLQFDNVVSCSCKKFCLRSKQSLKFVRIIPEDPGPHISTMAFFSAPRRVALSDIQVFFSSRSSFSFFCNSAFHSAYLFLADEACSLCCRSSSSSALTCERYFRSLLYCVQVTSRFTALVRQKDYTYKTLAFCLCASHQYAILI